MSLKQARYFPVKVFNKTLWNAAYVIAKYMKPFKKISKKFRSTIMMAVTNVNGCKACSYYHTSELIKAGATEEELASIIDATYDKVDKDETLAVLFAEHYADTTGAYEQETFDKVKDYYGSDKAHGILATIKFIMFGNIFGISMGNMWNRLRFRKVYNAKFLTDLYVLLFTPILFPIFIFLNLFRRKKTF